MNQPGRDAVNEGAGPIGEAAIAVASGGAVGAVKGVVGAAEGIMADEAGGLGDTSAGWIHGSDTPLTTDMMQRGRSMWLTQNPGVAKNVGNILHDVEIRPGAAVDITPEVQGATKTEMQRSAYDVAQKYQYHSPDVKYLDWKSPDGPIRILTNQRRDVLNIARKR